MMATVPVLRFELGRLSRRWGLWVVWAALCAVAVGELVNLPDRVPSPVRLWPLPVAYLASWGLAADLRRGGMDILICAGVRPTKLMLLRAGIAAVMGLALMALLIVPPLVRDPSQLGICIDLAVVALYWAFVGAALGFFIPSAGVVALAVIMVIGEGWWVTLGSGWLLNTPPTEGPAAAITVALHLLSFLPAREFPMANSVFPYEVLRLPVAAIFLALVARTLEHRSILVMEE